MIILPAIDIKNGECVRLVKGDFATSHKVAADPIETALSFKNSGAEYIHMVDLDGALEGKQINRDIFIGVAKATSLPIEIGGGIRDLKTVEDYLSNGIDRVILGSAALKDPSFVKECVLKFGEKIAVGIDAKDKKVSTDGWLNTSDVDYIDFAKVMESIGVKVIIYTDISRDGTLTGPNLEQLNAINHAVSCHIIASGGIKDIENIKDLTKAGLYGAICGKSIYEKTLNLEEAIKIAKG
jgi:phosphoribosylformimino-5-aminoimidazole carboxamide ribotide isomerase